MEKNGYRITNPRYEWKDGFYKSLANQVGADVQAIGERISKLAEENGSVTPKMMVDDARNEDSPMHSILFRKNDEEAAEAWREEEARKMQCAIEITFNKERIEIDGSTTKEVIVTRAFRHLSDSIGYQRTIPVFTNKDKLNQHIQDAINYLEMFKKKFNDILELKDFLKEVDDYIEILQMK